MNRTTLLALAFCLLSGVPALSQDLSNVYSELPTGNGFLAHCEKLDQPPNNVKYASKDACFGYFAGLWDTVYDLNYYYDLKEFCLPLKPDGQFEITNGQVISIFIKYLRDHPESRHHKTDILLIKSLRATFPCKK